MTQLRKHHPPLENDYYSVFDKTGKKICDTPSMQDVILMCSLDKTRTYKHINLLQDCIFNVPYEKLKDKEQLGEQLTLPDRTAEPFIV